MHDILTRNSPCVLQDLLIKVNEEVAESPQPGTIGVGDINAVLFPDDGCYYRAIITGVRSPNEIDVELVDYGNVFTVTPNEVKKLSEKLENADLPSDIFKMADISVADYQNPDLLAELADLMDRPFVCEITKLSEDPAVESEIRMWDCAGKLVGERWMSKAAAVSGATETAVVEKAAPPTEYPFLYDHLCYAEEYKVGQSVPAIVACIADPEYVFMTPGHTAQIGECHGIFYLSQILMGNFNGDNGR